MVRNSIYDKPMTSAERRRRSDAAKIARGEYRLTTWISPEAYEAMLVLTGGDMSRGAVQAILNEALLNYKRR
jgi:hypothetical protein